MRQTGRTEASSSRFPLALALALIAMLAGAPADASAATTIRLGDDFFSPASRTITVGTKVLFRWQGSARHNVTKRRGPGGPFASPTTRRRGVRYARRFREPGIYQLVCTLHSGMRLRLTVKR